MPSLAVKTQFWLEAAAGVESTADAPAGVASTGDAPAGDALAGDAPARDASAGDAPVELLVAGFAWAAVEIRVKTPTRAQMAAARFIADVDDKKRISLSKLYDEFDFLCWRECGGSTHGR